MFELAHLNLPAFEFEFNETEKEQTTERALLPTSRQSAKHVASQLIDFNCADSRRQSDVANNYLFLSFSICGMAQWRNGREGEGAFSNDPPLTDSIIIKGNRRRYTIGPSFAKH